MEYSHDYILGGAKDLSLLPFDVMSGPPESFTGCVRGLHVNNVVLPLEPQNIEGLLFYFIFFKPCAFILLVLLSILYIYDSKFCNVLDFR